MGLLFKYTRQLSRAGVLIALLFVLPIIYIYANYSSVIEITAFIENGDKFQIFVNNKSTPSTLNVVKGKVYTYRFENQVPIVNKLRIDPTDTNNAEFEIRDVKITGKFTSFQCVLGGCIFNIHNARKNNNYYSTTQDPILEMSIDNYKNIKKLLVDRLKYLAAIFLFNLMALSSARYKNKYDLIMQSIVNLVFIFYVTTDIKLFNTLQSSSEVVGMGNYTGYSFGNTILVFYTGLLFAVLISFFLIVLKKRGK